MIILKTIWKYKGMIAVLLIICLFICISKLRQTNSYLSGTIIEQKHEFSIKVDSIGRSHAITKVTEEFAPQLSASDKALVSKTAQIIKTKAADIDAVIQVNTTTTGHLEAILDTQGLFAYRDSFLTLKGHLEGSKLVEEYIYKDAATFTVYNKPKKLLFIKYSSDKYMDVFFNNPNTQITGLTNISLKKYMRPKKWGLGPQFGVRYDGTNVHWYIGAGISYNLIRF